MNKISIHKAQPMGRQPILDKTIILSREMPDPDTLQEMADLYAEDAKKIADALENTLPGGTFDRLLVELLTKKASLFKVSF